MKKLLRKIRRKKSPCQGLLKLEPGHVYILRLHEVNEQDLEAFHKKLVELGKMGINVIAIVAKEMEVIHFHD